MKNNFPQTEYVFKGTKVVFSWIRTDKPLDYQPWTQVYGVCFDHKGRILIIKDKKWKIPGGSPKKNESPEKTLRRELIEEADVVISQFWPLGVQKVDFLENPDPKMRSFYQYRYICLIEKLLSQTPDPDNGRIYPRKLVSAKEITNWVRWGPAGDAMFQDAIKLFKERIHK